MLIQLTYIMCVVYNCMSCLMLKGEQNEASLKHRVAMTEQTVSVR